MHKLVELIKHQTTLHGPFNVCKHRAGLLVSSATTGKTEPLQPGGALMLGNEQDCYGGCTDIGQAYNGLIDEVVVRTVVLDRSVCIRQLKGAQVLERQALI